MANAAVAQAPELMTSHGGPRPAVDGEPAITCRNVSGRFFTDRRSVTALSGIDLDVTRGELLTLLGPSGCGKSTLLRAVADLVTPSKGEIRVLGAPAETARRRRGIGFGFQDAGLVAWRAALEDGAAPPGRRRGFPGRRAVALADCAAERLAAARGRRRREAQGQSHAVRTARA